MDRIRDLPSWPHSETSRFIRIKTIEWHIQEMGRGPLLLLIHGAGASVHTWRDVMPLLARNWHVVALDLPGQGFTRTATLTRSGLDPMTEDIAALCRAEGWPPCAIIGHSAGAAIALNLTRLFERPPAVIGINAALGQFKGIASWLFPFLARILALNPLTASVFTLGGPNRERTRRLIGGTGSHLDERGLSLYAALFADRAHVDATLQMMTQWQIGTLTSRLAKIVSPTLLVTATGDRAVSPDTSDRAARVMKHAEVRQLAGLGHLCHEEAPEQMVELIAGFLRRTRKGAEAEKDPTATGTGRAAATMQRCCSR